MNSAFRRNAALTTAEARRRNLAAVFEAVREAPGRSRSEIAAEMPFSLQTMTNVVAELLDMGLVEETDHAGARRRGNPHRGLRIAGGRGHVIGLQIRWNAALLSLVDLSRQQVDRAEVPIAAAPGDAAGYLAQLERAVAGFMARNAGRDVWAIGLSAPLPIEVPRIPPHDLGPEPRVADLEWFQAFFREMTAQGLKDRLEARFARPVAVLNNPQSAALAEAMAVPADASFVYVLAGLGLGVTYVRDRTLSSDIWRQGGELGHVLYEGRTLTSALSAGSLRHALGLTAGQGEFERLVEPLAAAQPEIFDAWLARASEVLRFVVNFAESAVWPEAVVLGGFLPDPVLDRLIARTHPLIDSVVLADGAAGRRLPRLYRARTGAAAIPFGAAVAQLSFQSNPNWPDLIAAHRASA